MTELIFISDYLVASIERTSDHIPRGYVLRIFSPREINVVRRKLLLE